MKLQVFADQEELSSAAAAFVAEQAAAAIAARGLFNIALSGGSTPLSAYRILAAPPYSTAVDWAHVHVFWGDERCVPPDDAESNYGAAKAALLDHVALPEANIHRLRGELAPNEAAEAYRGELAAHFKAPGFPVFDLILLGLGEDGHTASLFPGTSGLRTGEVPVTETYVGRIESWRLTVTLPLINAARAVAFLVSGSGKAGVVREVLESDRPLPAKAVNPHSGELLWLLDADAAALLESSTDEHR